MKILLASLLALSVILNVVSGAAALYMGLMGCAEIADGKLGVLTRDLSIGRLDGTDPIFVLPKGLVVRDASASGEDWFEPHRFRLVVTSEDGTLVNYAADALPARDRRREFYSADLSQAGTGSVDVEAR